MKQQTNIIYTTPIPESYSNLKLFCEVKGLKYNTYSKKQLPFDYDGFEVHRVPHRKGAWANNTDSLSNGSTKK